MTLIADIATLKSREKNEKKRVIQSGLSVILVNCIMILIGYSILSIMILDRLLFTSVKDVYCNTAQPCHIGLRTVSSSVYNYMLTCYISICALKVIIISF